MVGVGEGKEWNTSPPKRGQGSPHGFPGDRAPRALVGVGIGVDFSCKRKALKGFEEVIWG